MRRVLHLRSSTTFAGPERHLLELLPALTDHRFEAAVATLYRRPPAGPEAHPLATRAARLGISAEVIADPRPLPRGPLRHLGCRFRPGSFDLLHSHDYKSDLVARWLARRRPVATVATVHLHTRSDWKLRLYRQLDRLLLRRFDAVILVSAALAEALPGIAATVIPNGVDGERLRREAGDPAATRAALGLADNGRLLLAVGRLERQKGFDLLIRALAALDGSEFGGRRPDVLLAVAGSGREEPALRQLAREQAVDDAVAWLGHREDVASLYAAADAVILPSRREGLPYVLLEALALGRPVVAARAGGIPEVVTDGDTGILVPIGDVTALAESIRWLLAHPRAAAALGDRGRRHAERCFSAPAMARRTAAVYRAALGPGDRRR